MVNNLKIELCANTIDDICIAAKYPFDTIELNSGAEIDGLTPSLSFFLRAKQLCNASLQIMIRPRAGGFCYSEELYKQMKIDLKMFLDHGADGIVFGFTDHDLNIDRNRTKEFVDIIHSYGKIATFHKAIDIVQNIEDALTFLNEIGIDRILTSPENVLMIKQQCPFIDVIAGGGINSRNVDSFTNDGIDHLHFSAKKIINDSFGSYYQADESELANIINKMSSN